MKILGVKKVRCPHGEVTCPRSHSELIIGNTGIRTRVSGLLRQLTSFSSHSTAS